METHELIEYGCYIAGVSAKELLSTSRDIKYVHARYVCYYLIKSHTRISTHGIADIFNKKTINVCTALLSANRVLATSKYNLSPCEKTLRAMLKMADEYLMLNKAV